MAAKRVPGAVLTPMELIATQGTTTGVYCVRACVGYVSGHVRGTRGKVARFHHPNGKVFDVYHCLNCKAYWKLLLNSGGK